jgi:Zn-finger nucleic acid-binding protein
LPLACRLVARQARRRIVRFSSSNDFGDFDVRLIACASCHTQYDVTNVIEESVHCRCGETIPNEPQVAVEAKVHRCGSCGAQVRGDAADCTYCGAEIVRDTRKLSLICPECHGRNADQSRFCTACGVAFAPETVKVDGFELPCPVCGCLMPARSVGGVGINECPSCNGLWAPGERLNLLINKAIEARRSNDPALLQSFEPRTRGGNPVSQRVAYRKCPECEAFMQRRNFRKSSGVIIDSCRKHGTWLDADELEQITGFVLSGGNAAATAILEEADTAARKVLAGAEFARSASRVDWNRSMRPMRSGGSLGGTLLGVLESILK